jgi:hypothetical protein
VRQSLSCVQKTENKKTKKNWTTLYSTLLSYNFGYTFNPSHVQYTHHTCGSFYFQIFQLGGLVGGFAISSGWTTSLAHVSFINPVRTMWAHLLRICLFVYFVTNAARPHCKDEEQIKIKIKYNHDIGDPCSGPTATLTSYSLLLMGEYYCYRSEQLRFLSFFPISDTVPRVS